MTKPQEDVEPRLEMHADDYVVVVSVTCARGISQQIVTERSMYTFAGLYIFVEEVRQFVFSSEGVILSLLLFCKLRRVKVPDARDVQRPQQPRGQKRVRAGDWCLCLMRSLVAGCGKRHKLSFVPWPVFNVTGSQSLV